MEKEVITKIQETTIVTIITMKQIVESIKIKTILIIFMKIMENTLIIKLIKAKSKVKSFKKNMMIKKNLLLLSIHSNRKKLIEKQMIKYRFNLKISKIQLRNPLKM